MKFLSKSSVMAIAAISLIAGVWWAWPSSSGNDSRPMKKHGDKRYGKVKKGDLIQRVTVSGQIQPARKTIFVAPFAGYIQKIYVSVGQKVQKGDPVVAVTSSLQSPEPVYPIRAPFAGTVVEVRKMDGEYVNDKDQKDFIVRIDDLSHYFVEAKAAELDAARIKKGMEVELRVSAIGDEVFKGVVREIDLAAEESDNWRSQQSAFKVRVEVEKPPAALRSGQSALLDVVTDKFTNVIYLEHEFINQEGNHYFVISKRGHRKDIKVGHQSDVAMEITSGVAEGDEIEQIDFLSLLENME